jgi:hypothetical protein
MRAELQLPLTRECRSLGCAVAAKPHENTAPLRRRRSRSRPRPIGRLVPLAESGHSIVRVSIAMLRVGLRIFWRVHDSLLHDLFERVR